MERIDKILANMGFGTRKEVKKLIGNGKVEINGEIIKKSDVKIDETTDKICVFGKKLIYRKYVYIMLNKPQGYVSATDDFRYPPVTDIVSEEYGNFNVFPVGRLDVDTEGLLILTNDGQFAHKVTSPKKHIAKTYFARLSKKIRSEDIKTFESGMDLGDFTAMPASLMEFSDGVLVTIYEGKYHQVKRMFEKVSNKVTYLKRIKIGGLELDKHLKCGEFREITQEEINLIFQ